METKAKKYNTSISAAMTQVGIELNVETDKWCENRRGWVNDTLKLCMAQKRNTNKNYRRMRKTCAVDDK